MYSFQHGGFSQRLDERLINKIGELVGEGVRSVAEMKRHLKIYVKKTLFHDNNSQTGTIKGSSQP